MKGKKEDLLFGGGDLYTKSQFSYYLLSLISSTVTLSKTIHASSVGVVGMFISTSNSAFMQFTNLTIHPAIGNEFEIAVAKAIYCAV